MRLLLVEDSTTLRERLHAWLIAHGWTVDAVANGQDALAFVAGYDYQLVLLDLGLPDIDGQEVLARMRAAGCSARVLVLSARDQLDERVTALNRGADDYLVKPFALEELSSRLLALMRRSLDSAPPVLRHGILEVDPSVRVARVEGMPLALTPKEYLLLEALLRNRGQLMTRPALFELLYDSRSAASDKVIEVLISTLRGKLAQAGVADFIETRRGFGYLVG